MTDGPLRPQLQRECGDDELLRGYRRSIEQVEGHDGPTADGPDSNKPESQRQLVWRERRERRVARWLCLRPSDTLDLVEQKILTNIPAEDPGLAIGYDLRQRFRQVLHDREVVDALWAWSANAQASDLRPFRALADGLLDNSRPGAARGVGERDHPADRPRSQDGAQGGNG